MIDGLVAYGAAEATLAGSEGAHTVDGEVVSGNFFFALGVPLRAGRAIVDADESPGAAPSRRLGVAWRDRLTPRRARGRRSPQRPGVPVIGVAASHFAGMAVGRRGLLGSARTFARCWRAVISSRGRPCRG